VLILGVESSCDETAAAVVADGRAVLSDVVASQIAVHRPYGGVVPELASRKHVEAVLPVIQTAMDQAGLRLDELDAVAATQGPGLIGALLVGLSAAKAIAYAAGKPMVAVNHLEGHMAAAFLEAQPPERAWVCLVVSGGHTALYRVQPDGRGECLGTTLDDAAGEAFDKVSKVLGLGYPGGAAIDLLARSGDPRAHRFPRSYLEKNSLDFSFSGLKTAVAYFVKKSGVPAAGAPGGSLEDLAAAFQEAVVDVLVMKTLAAAARCGVRDLAVVGGVAANSRLRERFELAAASDHLRLHLPPLRYCTDNAAMIAAAGYQSWRRNGFCRDPLYLDARSRWL